uniref:Leucine-rich repeat protein SHOC-2 n=1 Tax=Sus scrofa TaxID=9823 RepID=A0A8D1Q7Z2_PIG
MNSHMALISGIMNFLILVSFIHMLCLCFRLKSLTYLSLNNNHLFSIPRELCFLETLSELQLNYNQLICIPEEIKFLKKLQKLLLSRNNIEYLPEGLCNLLNLRILDIAGNVIQMFPPGFQGLKLKEFYCEGNPLFLKQPVNAVKQEDVWSLQDFMLLAQIMGAITGVNQMFILFGNSIKIYNESASSKESFPNASHKMVPTGQEHTLSGKKMCDMWKVLFNHMAGMC